MLLTGNKETIKLRRVGFVLSVLAGAAVVLAFFGQSVPHDSQTKILIPIGLILAFGFLTAAVVLAIKSNIQDKKRKPTKVIPKGSGKVRRVNTFK